jgi:hypothetical protein
MDPADFQQEKPIPDQAEHPTQVQVLEGVPPGHPKQVKAAALFTLAQDIRGPIIEQAIYIDLVLTDIITYELCATAQDGGVMRSLILETGEITLSSKMDIVERLLRLRHKDLLAKYPTNELHAFRRLRNRLAHGLLDSSDEAIESMPTDRVTVLFFADGVRRRQV